MFDGQRKLKLKPSDQDEDFDWKAAVEEAKKQKKEDEEDKASVLSEIGDQENYDDGEDYTLGLMEEDDGSKT